MKPTARILLLISLGLFAGLLLRKPDLIPGGTTLKNHLLGRATVEDRLGTYGPNARARLRPHFERVGLSYPPPKLIMVGLKREERLELYAEDEAGRIRFIRHYPVLTASGGLGPKLRYGDGQVPEGFYRIESLNPNSAYHLSLRLNYPNEFDREQAQREGRSNLGGDIMIHGKAVSIGCLEMGDEAAEDLFVLAADTGLERISVLMCPVDFRTRDLPDVSSRPGWVKGLYVDLRRELMKLPQEKSKGA